MIHEYLQHRRLQVEKDLAAKKKTCSEYTSEMYQYRAYLTGDKGVEEEVRYAFELFQDPVRRELVESLLFAGASHEDILEGFKVPLRSLKVYESLYFDSENAFLSDLDRISYIENYPDPFGKLLKQRAHSLGASFIFYKYGNIVPNSATQQALVKKMFFSSAYRAMEANFNPMNSAITKNALDWSKQMIKSFEVMEKLMNSDMDKGMELLEILTTRGSKFSDDAETISDEDIV